MRHSIAGSRVKLAMVERDHLPGPVERIGAESGTPTVAVLVTDALVLAFFVTFTVVFGSPPGVPGGQATLGLESLAHFAEFMLLAGLTFVNVALVQSRRKRPELERRFRTPGVPWVPLVVIGSNLALLASLELLSVSIGVLAVADGVVVWVAVLDWGRIRPRYSSSARWGAMWGPVSASPSTSASTRKTSASSSSVTTSRGGPQS